MFCPNCGTQVPDYARFCPNCGEPLTTPPIQPGQPNPQQMQTAPNGAKKKSRTPLIIGCVVGCVVLACIIYFVWSGSQSSTTSTDTSTITTSEPITTTQQTTNANATNGNWSGLPTAGPAFMSNSDGTFGSRNAPIEGGLVSSNGSEVFFTDASMCYVLVSPNGATEATPIYSTDGSATVFDILAGEDGRVYVTLLGQTSSSLEVRSFAADGSDEQVLYSEPAANFGELYLADGCLYLYSYDPNYSATTNTLVRLPYNGASQLSFEIPGTAYQGVVSAGNFWYMDLSDNAIYHVSLASGASSTPELVSAVPSSETLSGLYASGDYIFATTLDSDGNAYVTSLNADGANGRVQIPLDASEVSGAQYSQYEIGVVDFDARNGASLTTLLTSTENGDVYSIVRANLDGTGAKQVATINGTILEITPCDNVVGIVSYDDSGYRVDILSADGSSSTEVFSQSFATGA